MKWKGHYITAGLIVIGLTGWLMSGMPGGRHAG